MISENMTVRTRAQAELIILAIYRERFSMC
ncbi:hypothetical protein F477_01243 [Pseudomonas sp. URIL14HWK12:I3]|nr:hypothetical protein F478_04122 [Pseudomonas sp. URIL14HWK12:I2]PZW59805.1 hypothetical protein F477_01243 [Pseudomonas sp. URIL14HWK12:I3]SNB79703.1 hypothetical protein SAMN02746026_03349 [Pseudomonas sp. LAIL14HWK12:I4]